MTREIEITNFGLKMVTITREEYDSLLEDAQWIRALLRAGVDDWEGYDFAQEYFNEEEADK